MSQSRDFGPLAGQMRSALERYSKEELIDLMTHIIRVYVMEDTLPGTPDVHRPQAPEELARLSFPQLLVRLQMMLQLDELARFRVSGDDVFVTIGDTELNFHGPAPEGKKPTAAQKALQSMRGAPDVEPEDEEEAPPASPVTGEPDFEIDDLRTNEEAEEEEPKAEKAEPKPERAPSRPTPQPLGPRAGGGRGGGVFGGGGGGRSPMPPPPIAESAPGDPTPEERAAANQESKPGSEDREERKRRAGFEESPPPLAEGDKQINPSNRFADLELD